MRRETITDEYGNKRKVNLTKTALLTMQCNTTEQGIVCNHLIHDIQNSEIIYDYIIGYESKDEHNYTDHIHIALFFRQECITEGITAHYTAIQEGTNIIGLDIKYPEDKDQNKAWIDIREYARKKGNYIWKLPLYPRNVRDENPQWLSWQQEVINEQQNDRQVTVVIDEQGGIGKSYLSKWHEVRKKAVAIEIIESYKDVLRQVYAQPAEWYIIDIPRALSVGKNEKDHRRINSMRQLFGAIEKIKDGESYDDRYRFHKDIRDPPKVTVLMNDEPDMNLLTRNRWHFIRIDEEKHKKIMNELAKIHKQKMAAAAEAATIEKDGRKENEKQPDDQYALRTN